MSGEINQVEMRELDRLVAEAVRHTLPFYQDKSTGCCDTPMGWHPSTDMNAAMEAASAFPVFCLKRGRDGLYYCDLFDGQKCAESHDSETPALAICRAILQLKKETT